MKGLISPKIKGTIYSNFMKTKLGFKIDNINDCYVKEGYGAYMGTLPIKNTEELKEYLNMPYYQNFISKGYYIVAGPPALDEQTNKIKGLGLYCKNYEELLETKKRKTHR